MLVFGEMHLVTLIFVLLELTMLGVQLGYYLSQPGDGHRAWYLVLLLLLLFYNVTGGLFPDPKVTFLSLRVQNIIAYGSGFLMASYFPFYFYKAFELRLLRFHAIYGVPLFLLLPYLIFFVISYSLNGNLDFAIRYGIIIPFFYSFIVLKAILTAIRKRYRENRLKSLYMEEIAVYCAVVPWAALTVITYFHFSQLVEVLLTNLGFVVITGMFIFKTACREKVRYMEENNLTIDGLSPEQFQANCLYFGLTKTEILIVMQLYKGMTNKEIASALLVSEETVKKHIQNTFRKANVKNRAALIHRLQNARY
ncbi:LuxR family transcriptional regulator [Pedobacter sp. ISL-68]|uniref:LuxR family transcriptional regulator n=1 Tax=unclassified Pedobacter TaxID=2628915 RepID=UPI001BECA14A|nr:MULTISPECIES: LuxR family transcriptional regulator [unclassified Pedobacter]MBT2560158.1 LuxR family transcriptional regulator [Pedobacter sp. ISL-64]MBT2589137.1 LuxR family transcriptional regulator [Pedobacter sp. ISL-68]